MDTDYARLAAAEALLGATGWPQASGNDGIVEVYLATVQSLTPSRRSLIEAGFDPPLVDYALLLLHHRKVIDASNPEALVIHPPKAALQRYATELETFATTARQAIEPLTELYRQVRSVPEDPDQLLAGFVSLVHSRDDVLEIRRTEAARARQRTIRLIAASPDTLAELRGEIPGVDIATESRHLEERLVLVHMSVFNEEGTLAALLALEAAGCRVRLFTSPALTLSIFDDDCAILDLSSADPHGPAALVVRYRPIVKALAKIMELQWRSSLPLPVQGRASALGMDTRDLQIITLLGAGSSDVTIARQLGISQRTVERRLRAYMDSHGLETRYQLGVFVGKAQTLER
ncbi:MAG: helix-turn-helix domain-containing protein [Tetrasphaera sp.]|nr:helix-turn-helix domain-containing protein [Tetrasphaera sp.]